MHISKRKGGFKLRILVAEDDENMCKILKLYLQKEGYSVAIVLNGKDAISYLEKNKADLLLLDWMLPLKTGIEVCKELRLMKIPIKIIMLTAKTTTDNELLGLTVGADDYIRKPFDMKILLIRIKKLCNSETELKYRDIILNPATHEVLQNHQTLELTKKEFELLKYFLLNQNIVLSREQILSSVWGMDYFGEERTVDTHVRRLRKKIGECYIQTKIGTGYIMGDTND